MLILAQAAAAPAPAAGDGGNSFWISMLPIALIVVIMWFLLIRPQRKKEKDRQAMLHALEKNDRIVTIGGIQGVVKNVGDSDVTICIDEKHDVTIKINRSAVYAIMDRNNPSEVPSDQLQK